MCICAAKCKVHISAHVSDEEDVINELHHNTNKKGIKSDYNILLLTMVTWSD